ncbi:MAG: hypothetical protein ACYS22_12060 [Planctomycetota bacterium]
MREEAPGSSPAAVVQALSEAVEREDCHAVARLFTAPFGPALLETLESADQLEATAEALEAALITRRGHASAAALPANLASARRPYVPFSGTLEVLDLRHRADRGVARMRSIPARGAAREFDLGLRGVAGRWLLEAGPDAQVVQRSVAGLTAHRTRLRALAMRYERTTATLAQGSSSEAVLASRR